MLIAYDIYFSLMIFHFYYMYTAAYMRYFIHNSNIFSISVTQQLSKPTFDRTCTNHLMYEYGEKRYKKLFYFHINYQNLSYS